MTAAYRLKGLGWFACCMVVTLGFYLVSLQVAAERKRLEQLETQIRSAEREVRALETEFDTRANLAQLERWNGETLSLVAPTAAQFVPNEATLAQVRFDGALGQDVKQAALVVPSYTPQSVTAPATPTPPPAPAPAIVEPVRATSARVELAEAKPARAPAVKVERVAMLLSNDTLGDILRGAGREAGAKR